jgi:hypothetical protein
MPSDTADLQGDLGSYAAVLKSFGTRSQSTDACRRACGLPLRSWPSATG